MSVGVTKDYKLKVRNLHASHTLENGDHPAKKLKKLVKPEGESKKEEKNPKSGFRNGVYRFDIYTGNARAPQLPGWLHQGLHYRLQGVSCMLLLACDSFLLVFLPLTLSAYSILDGEQLLLHVLSTDIWRLQGGI
jgi:hypothetical protein